MASRTPFSSQSVIIFKSNRIPKQKKKKKRKTISLCMDQKMGLISSFISDSFFFENFSFLYLGEVTIEREVAKLERRCKKVGLNIRVFHTIGNMVFDTNDYYYYVSFLSIFNNVKYRKKDNRKQSEFNDNFF